MSSKCLSLICKVGMVSLVVSAVGCASAPKVLTDTGRSVKLMKSDAPSDCKELGAVRGEAQLWETEEAAKNRMRNNAAKMGANYVRMETVEKNSDTGFRLYTGTAYNCP